MAVPDSKRRLMTSDASSSASGSTRSDATTFLTPQMMEVTVAKFNPMYCDCFSVDFVQDFEDQVSSDKRMDDAELKTLHRLQGRYWKIGYTMEGVVFKKQLDDFWSDQVFCL